MIACKPTPSKMALVSNTQQSLSSGYNSKHSLVWPGDGEELLPPPRRNVGYVEAEDEGQRDQVQECIKVLHNRFKQSETDNKQVLTFHK